MSLVGPLRYYPIADSVLCVRRTKKRYSVRSDVASVLAENLDRLMTIELRPGSGNLPRGIVRPLYEAVRSRVEKPLTYLAAKNLVSAVREKKKVYILTGAGAAPYLPKSEVDGLLGAVVVARALGGIEGVEVTILCEERAIDPLKATIWASSMNPWDVSNFARPPQENSIGYLISPIEREACEKQANDLIDAETAALVAIEKLSTNRLGIIHGATGLNYHDSHTKPDVYFAKASEHGVYTCGIGDNGNEVGFGVVRDVVEEVMEAGYDCGCPCGGGTAANIATDDFIVAAISNWGAYALAGLIAHNENMHDRIVSRFELDRMLRACVDAGALDGGTARPTYSDDAVPYEAQMAYIEILNVMLKQARTHFVSPGH